MVYRSSMGLVSEAHSHVISATSQSLAIDNDILGGGLPMKTAYTPVTNMWKRLKKMVLHDESGEVYEQWEVISITSPVWSTLPEDIIKMITDWLVVGYEEYRPSYQLKAFSLVCRDWHKRFSPYIKRSLCPKRRIQGTELISRLREAGNTYEHTDKLLIKYAKNMTPNVVCELSSLLPKVTALNITGTDWNNAPCAHPSWSKIFAGAWAGFNNTSGLVLSYCRFHSSGDLLRVLASLPALRKVNLEAITWSRPTDATPLRACNRLRSLDAERMDVWPLSRLWMLPHCGPNALADSYPGYSRLEGEAVAHIMQALPEHLSRGIRVRLRRSIYPHTWILSATTSATRYSNSNPAAVELETGLEIHVSPSKTSSRGQIRWIVFRFGSIFAQICRDSEITKVGQSLAQLPMLEAVFLEGAVDYLSTPKGLECLGDRVRSWSHKTARTYAQLAKKRGPSDNALEQLPVSPKWLSNTK